MSANSADPVFLEELLLNITEVPWKFCFGYHYRDYEKGDPGTGIRPEWAISDEEENPEWYPGPSIVGVDDSLIDRPSLRKRTLERKEFDRDTGKKLIKAAFGDVTPSLRMACYTPHHAVIFYDADHQPIALIEICFDCYIAKCRITRGEEVLITILHTPDFIDLAKIFTAKGIQLHGTHTFKEFKESTENLAAKIQELNSRKQQGSTDALK